VILSDLTKSEDACKVANDIVDEFSSPIELHGRKQFVTVSIGSATYGCDAVDASSLLKNADLALYRAKDEGRNQARSYSTDMGTGSVERMEMESALREAIAKKQLALHYQPKVDEQGRFVGLEALLRWTHPVFGTIPPGKFIPLAEDTGMIIPIGAWVLQEAARQARQWVADGLPVLPISVNVSALQFAQPDFVHTVSSALAVCGLRGSWLELELTESLIMRNICDAEDKLSQLRDLGVETAIDDFGIGYSSLAYLQRLSLDTLKIDHSFVSAIEISQKRNNGRAIIGAIVALARSLGLQVVAEGVETLAQRDFLLQIGCRIFQGFLYCPPRTAEQIEPLLRNQAPLAPQALAQPA
jgi:EAL domain-containing protein (putative c-di-GMP-specific phosphodiesterase class I)